MCWQKRTDAGTSARMGPGPAGTLRGQRAAGLFCATDQSQLFPLPLCGGRRQRATPRSPKPGSTMATAEFTSCSGGRAGGIIINVFTDSIASRVCPCVSNAHVEIKRHSGDSPSLRGCIRIMSGDLRGPESELNGGCRDAEHHCAQTSYTTVAENR